MIKASLKNKSFELQFSDKKMTTGKLDGNDFTLYIDNEENLSVDFNNTKYAVDIVSVNEKTKTVKLKINSVSHEVKVEDEMDLLLKKLGMQLSNGLKMNELKAPMPGLVLEVLVKEGQEIKKGDSLLILEAMKMENNIKAIADAKVKSIKCKAGNAVEKNELLILFE